MKQQLLRLKQNTLKVAAFSGLMFSAITINAQTDITIENGDFSLPGDAKYQNWESIPGWSSDTPATDSGVEIVGTAFLLTSDPSVYNVTDHIIASGEAYTLTLGSLYNVYNTENGSFTVTLFYTNDDGATRTPIASKTFDTPNPETPGGVEFTTASIPDAVGANLGIEFDNTSNDGGDGWHGFDNVTLSYSSTLSVDNFEVNSFKIYPNPSRENYFKIALKTPENKINIKAFNILGKEVFNQSISPISKTVEIKHNLKPGMYIIQLNNVSTSKLIVR